MLASQEQHPLQELAAGLGFPQEDRGDPGRQQKQGVHALGRHRREERNGLAHVGWTVRS